MHRLFCPTVAVVALCMSAFATGNVSARDDVATPMSHFTHGSISWRAEKGYAVRLLTALVSRMWIGTRAMAAIACGSKANGSLSLKTLW